MVEAESLGAEHELARITAARVSYMKVLCATMSGMESELSALTEMR